MGKGHAGIDRFDARAWAVAGMNFGWYLAIGSVVHALCWMGLTLLGIDALSTRTYAVFVALLAAWALALGYHRAGAQLRRELMHFYRGLSEELVEAAVRRARLTSGQHDLSLAEIRLEARKSLAATLGEVRYETLDTRWLLDHAFEESGGDVTRVRRHML